MKKFNLITPEGTKDILFEPCIARRELEKKVKDIFTAKAYNEVITPGIEYYDVFNMGDMNISQTEMYKTTDNKGRIVVFRADSTLPVARMVSTRLKDHSMPLRLYYNQSVYRNRVGQNGASHETTQAGIELLGASGLMADLEVITTAVDTLKATKLNFRIEIGDANIFKILVDKLCVSEDVKEEIRSVIESKNYAALKDITSQIEPSIYTKAIEHLPRLFGGEEVFEKAKDYCSDEEFATTLDYLRTVYNSLCELGLSDNVIVDLGLVQKNHYYTGIVFSAYVENHGMAVISGGRYDNLLEKFSNPIKAVGFALEIDAIANIIVEDKSVKVPDVLVYCEKGLEVKAQIKIKELISNGVICETSFFDTIEETKAYADEKGIKEIIVIKEA